MPLHSGYIYLIGSKWHSWYKIGKSRHREIRIDNLGILLPFKIELYALWLSDNHHFLERQLHEKYRSMHVHGEWFSFNEGERESLIKELMPDLAKRVFPIFAGEPPLPIRCSVSENTSRKREKNRQPTEYHLAADAVRKAYLILHGPEMKKPAKLAMRRAMADRFSHPVEYYCQIEESQVDSISK